MENFEELINSEKPVLVDFFATWCGPCRMMEKPLEELKEEFVDKADIIKLDVDINNGAASKYNVRGVPTFIIFKKGEMVWRQSGAMPKDVLKQKLTELCNN